MKCHQLTFVLVTLSPENRPLAIRVILEIIRRFSWYVAEKYPIKALKLHCYKVRRAFPAPGPGGAVLSCSCAGIAFRHYCRIITSMMPEFSDKIGFFRRLHICTIRCFPTVFQHFTNAFRHPQCRIPASTKQL
jgi:hypothetical protein